MSNDPQKQSIPEIVFATKEARELYRIRNSFTFNLGLELIRSAKNPFRLFIFPLTIFRLMFTRKRLPPKFNDTPRSGFIVIGVDRIGQNHSMQAELLALTISKSSLGDVTLLNNSLVPSTELNEIEWYRIPPVREKNKSRKEWNLMVERLLSSTISIYRPEHVIYFGDYLYRGVVDALSPIESSVPITWFLPHIGKEKQINVKNLPKINPILLPEFSDNPPPSQSIHRILRRSESENILLTDIAPKNTNLSDLVVKRKNNSLVTAIQREHPLPEGIDLVVRMKEVAGMQIEGNVTLVIDDDSPLLASLSTLRVPCLLLRTGKNLSPIIDEMVRDLELKGSLVVVRRNTIKALSHSLDYLEQLSVNPQSHTIFAHGDSLSQAHYVLKWLNSSTQSYN